MPHARDGRVLLFVAGVWVELLELALDVLFRPTRLPEIAR